MSRPRHLADPVAVPLNAPAFATISQTIAVSGTSFVNHAGGAGGVGGTPFGNRSDHPGGTTLTQTLQSGSSTPAGLPTPADILRQPAAGSRSAQAESSPITPLLFAGLGFSQTSVVTPGHAITLPASFFAVSGAAFYIALYDPTRPALGWISRFATCTSNATTLTLTCTANTSLTFVGGQTYWFMLYAVSVNAPRRNRPPSSPRRSQIALPSRPRRSREPTRCRRPAPSPAPRFRSRPQAPEPER